MIRKKDKRQIKSDVHKRLKEIMDNEICNKATTLAASRNTKDMDLYWKHLSIAIDNAYSKCIDMTPEEERNIRNKTIEL